MVDAPRAQPETYARALLAKLRLARVQDLNAFAGSIGLKVREVDSEGFEGALVRVPNRPKGIIAVKRSIRERGRKRFTVMHEVGHYVLPGHGVVDCVCKTENIESWRRSVPEHEVSANRFAAELLLPRAEVAKYVRQHTATISVARKVCDEFEASLTASTLKCVEVTEEECAVVWSEGGLIKWCRPNDNFRYYVRVNERVSADSFAAELFKGPLERERDGSVPAEAWVSSYRLHAGATLWEDSILLPYYNSVLTILTITNSLERKRGYDEPLTEDLDPQEFTLRRKTWGRT